MNPGRLVVRSAAFAAALLLATAGPAAAETRPPAIAPPAEAQAGDILVMLRLPPDHLRPGAEYGKSYGDPSTSRARRRLAREIAARHGLELVGDGWPMPHLGIDCYVMRPPPGKSVQTVIAALANESQIAWSQPVQLYGAPAGGTV